MTDFFEQLGQLAFRFRGTRDVSERQMIADEYAVVWAKLKEAGVEEFPTPEEQLPDNFMPKDWWK